jgi:ectoine hydroxylase-related dioxygenase (phytanoyl-CoA dioxygenase family)
MMRSEMSLSRAIPPGVISNDTVAQFQRDGAACIRQLFQPDELAELCAGIDLNLAAPSPRAKVASNANDPGYFIEDFCNWQDNPHYRRFIVESPLAEAAARLMRSTTARLYHDHMLTKEPGTRQATPGTRINPTTISKGVRTSASGSRSIP